MVNQPRKAAEKAEGSIEPIKKLKESEVLSVRTRVTNIVSPILLAAGLASGVMAGEATQQASREMLGDPNKPVPTKQVKPEGFVDRALEWGSEKAIEKSEKLRQLKQKQEEVAENWAKIHKLIDKAAFAGPFLALLLAGILANIKLLGWGREATQEKSRKGLLRKTDEQTLAINALIKKSQGLEERMRAAENRIKGLPEGESVPAEVQAEIAGGYEEYQETTGDLFPLLED